jgi:NAD(P)H-dependent FMN reductase
MSDASRKTLLIVWHSRTGTALQMKDAAVRGARMVLDELQACDMLDIVVRPAAEACAEDVLRADGYLFCAPENLATLSGAMKEFFDQTYYAALDRVSGRPYALMVSAGTDGSGAVRLVERICSGWRLRAVAPALIARTGADTPETIAAPKTLAPEDRASCETLGGTLAALLV